MPPRRPSLADGECQERTYAHQFTCLQKCLIDARSGVIRHVEADRYVHFLTRCEAYLHRAEPNAAGRDAVAGLFGDQITTQEPELRRVLAIVAQPRADLSGLARRHGIACAKEGDRAWR